VRRNADQHSAAAQAIPQLPDSSGWGIHVLAIARAPDSAYGPRNHSDTVYQEHFGISDVPSGEYVMGVQIGTKRVYRRVKVEPGKLTWVEFKP
jgi:hypothetical protein